MHAVMLTVPGWVFKVLAPCLVLWGLYSLLISSIEQARSRRSAVPMDGARTTFAIQRFVPADEPPGALASVAIGCGIFLFSAPVKIADGSLPARLLHAFAALGRGVFDGAVWVSKWASLPIYSYGIMLGASLVVGWYVTLG